MLDQNYGKISPMKHDVFVSHASEDKEFVRTLVAALELQGISVWYDEHELMIGDSLRRSIDRGLSDSRYGLVVLSWSFFDKKWPQRELDALVAREDAMSKVILPLWHGVTAEDVRSFSPMLAGIFAVRTDQGLGSVVKNILEVVRPELGRTKARILDDLAAMSTTIFGYLVGELKNREHSQLTLLNAIKTARDSIMVLTKALSDISRATDPAVVQSIIKQAETRFAKVSHVTSRCMICGKTLDEMDRGQEVIMKSGMKAIKGFCPECGFNVFRILGKWHAD